VPGSSWILICENIAFGGCNTILRKWMGVFSLLSRAFSWMINWQLSSQVPAPSGGHAPWCAPATAEPKQENVLFPLFLLSAAAAGLFEGNLLYLE
jgi:hypothetical protein